MKPNDFSLHDELLDGLVKYYGIDPKYRPFLDADALLSFWAVFQLGRIRQVLENLALSDFYCVEEIVEILCEAGIPPSYRHDF